MNDGRALLLSTERLVAAFTSTYGAAPGHDARAVFSPGRINVIGEHTDYNDGFALPAAVQGGILLLAAPVADETITLTSLDVAEPVHFRVADAAPSAARGWGRYAHAIVAALAEAGVKVRGLRGVLASDLPRGGGMSSSAALCVGLGRALATLADVPLSNETLARAAQRAEHLVGVRVGILDPWAVAHGRRDHAMLLDCRTLDTSHIPLSLAGHVLVVADTAKARGLVDSAYNERREQCAEAVRLLAASMNEPLAALRDVSVEDLDGHASSLSPVLFARARHVVSENQRVLDAAQLLRSDEPSPAGLGALLDASHASLRDRFQVSCFELDTLVDLVRARDGVLGARMMGGGFGGCTISLVRADRVDDVIAHVGPAYRERTSLTPSFWTVHPGEGTHALGR